MVSNSFFDGKEPAYIHDPMCWYADPDKIPAVAVNDGWPCLCSLIARVREDERMRDDDYAYVSKQSEAEGYATALRDAVEAVKSRTLRGAFAASLDKHESFIAVSVIDSAVAAIESLGGER